MKPAGTGLMALSPPDPVQMMSFRQELADGQDE
jgi:hypothetical protein